MWILPSPITGPQITWLHGTWKSFNTLVPFNPKLNIVSNTLFTYVDLHIFIWLMVVVEEDKTSNSRGSSGAHFYSHKFAI